MDNEQVPQEQLAQQPIAQPVAQPPAMHPNPMDPPPEPTVSDKLKGTSYTTVDELIDGYNSLHAEFTKRNQQNTWGDNTQTPTEEVTQEAAPTEESSQPSWDWNTAFDKYDYETGWGQDASDHFKSIGLPEEIADDYMRLKHLEKEFVPLYFKQQALQMVGDEETLNQVLTFVNDNMSAVHEDLQNPNKFQYVLEAAVSRMKREGALGGDQPSAPAEPSNAPEATPQNRGVSGDYLVPGSPDAIRAAADPRMRTDFEYQQRVYNALKRGANMK